MVASFTTVGTPVKRGEGPDKVSGRTLYTADVSLPGALWGKALRSPLPHARIVSIDVSRAWQVPGVHAVITGQDIPPTLVGRLLRDCPVLARDRVRFVGEKVAAVAAEDSDAAEEALLLIDVEYEELPAVFDPVAAMEPSAPALHPEMAAYVGLPQPVSPINNVLAHNQWGKGDVAQGFRESDRVFEHTFSAHLMHQGYIEPHACMARVDDSGRVEMWVNNKAPFNLRSQLSAVWDMPEDRITIHPVSIGGDFGGKGSFMDAPLCYYLALNSGRPVKMVMDYLEELQAGNPRHPATITLKTGVKNDGRLWAREASVVFNSGAYGAFKPRVYLGGADHLGGAYRVPNVSIDSFMVYTNNIPCGHMRAPAKPQVHFAVESHMDMIAEDLGLDPLEFRLRNVIKTGDETPTGGSWEEVRAEETLRGAAQAAGWGRPRERANVGKGMAISDQPPGTGQSEARVAIDAEGKVEIQIALWDTGTGAHTMLRQVVAEELTVPVDDVRIFVLNTDAVAFDSGSGGSRVTYTAGQTALGAAKDLKAKLVQRAAGLYETEEDRITLADGSFQIRDTPERSVPLKDVASRAIPDPEGTIVGEFTFSATTSPVTSYCTQIAEVEVDTETGQVRVERIVTAHDVGTIINPLTHQGQIEGGVIQGLGYALMEELGAEEGRISTLTLGDYKMPTMPDVPKLETVLLESLSGPAPFQSKGIGESSNVPIAGAIANAVYDAVGVRITSLPITSEKVLLALRDKSQV